MAKNNQPTNQPTWPTLNWASQESCDPMPRLMGPHRTMAGGWWFILGRSPGKCYKYAIVITILVPSDELSQFAMERSTMLLMGKSTISTGPCSIAMLVHQRVSCISINHNVLHHLKFYDIQWSSRNSMAISSEIITNGKDIWWSAINDYGAPHFLIYPLGNWWLNEVSPLILQNTAK